MTALAPERVADRLEKLNQIGILILEQFCIVVMSLETRAAPIKLILSDVDGVLTDGTIEINHNGDESKRFCTLDGYGIRMWKKAGFDVGLITGRDCPCIYYRAANLGINILRAGTFAKWEAVIAIAAELQLSYEEIAFIGDDYPDLPAIRGVGLGVTVPHAPQELKNAAEYITQRPGGHGAVRDLIDQIFKVKGICSCDCEQVA